MRADVCAGSRAQTASLIDLPSSPLADDTLRRVGLITWRGMATKLMTALYETREGWEMQAMVLDGVLYLEEYRDPTARVARAEDMKSSRAFSYVGCARIDDEAC